jgi:hypothetical protein
VLLMDASFLTKRVYELTNVPSTIVLYPLVKLEISYFL